MFARILVPLDGSKLAERALPHAEMFARAFHGRLILLRVLEPSSAQTGMDMIDPLKWQIMKTEADLYLKSIASDIKQKNIDIDTSLLEGNAAENIIQFAHTQNIDLLIISSHGQSGLSRWNTSSVVQKVLDKIYLPVLIIRSYVPIGSDDNSVQYQHILLPVDGSKRAECSLPAAIAIASESGGKIVLASVIRHADLPFSGPQAEEITRLSEDLVQLNRDAAQNYLEELSEHLQIETEVRVIEGDSVIQALQTEVENGHPDLLILCAHGRNGWMQWPYGSVANNFLYYGTLPTLVIQDAPLSQIKPTPVELAAERYGRR